MSGSFASLRDRSRLPVVGLALLVLVGTFVFSLAGQRIILLQPDETLYVGSARYLVEHFPGALLEWDVYERGIQRLAFWLLAVPFAVTDMPRAFRLAHVLQAGLFASAAIPAFLLARGLRIPGGWALVVALLTLLVPWAVLSTMLLTEPLSYAVTGWVLFLVWRCLVRPSPLNDVLALAAVLIAALSRTGYIALLPLPFVAAAWHVLRIVPLREAPRAFARQHPVLLGVAVLGLVVAVAGDLPTRLRGNYPLPDFSAFGGVLERQLTFFARVCAGTGLLPAAVAIPWVLRTLFRPADEERHALAVIGTLVVLAVLASVASAPPEERYVMFLAPVVLLAAATAVARRDVGPLGIGLGAAAVIALLASVAWDVHLGGYGWFSGPAETFYREELAGRLGGEMVVWVLVALAAAGVAFALHRRAGRVLVAAVAVLVALQSWQATRALTQWAGPVAGAGVAFAPRAFVDFHVPDDEEAGAVIDGVGNLGEWVPIWTEAYYWNSQVGPVVAFQDTVVAPVPRGEDVIRATVDQRTGAVSTSAPLPRYLVRPTALPLVALRVRPVGGGGNLPAEVIELDGPPRADWELTGTTGKAEIGPAQPGRLRVFTPEAGTCGVLDLGVGPRAGTRATVRAAGRRRRVALPGRVEVPLGPAARDIVIRGASTQVTAFAIADCD